MAVKPAEIADRPGSDFCPRLKGYRKSYRYHFWNQQSIKSSLGTSIGLLD